MLQSAAVFSKVGTFKLELPPANIEILAGVRWGAIDAFPTPAYWLFQIFERRLTGGPPNYKLGRTLAEELGACLLGGHGISADVGIAAYKRLKSEGIFELNADASEQRIFDLLLSPLDVFGRQVRYRFAAQKARYLSGGLELIHGAPVNCTGRVLREWLVTLPGVGLKTASWIARNWMGADDVAILDIHILRFGQAIGLFDRSLKVERDYLKLEEQFLAFSAGMDTKPSELDAVIWHEMANSPFAVREMTRAAESKTISSTKVRRQVRDRNQLTLI
ncbi:8-oxoguanine DNA glycosylase [Lampropedia aestuarii]|uniref:8-oxoguanine DNA glycosylase n=1 Tax=Lampropedia aestuarii TaxID=2562762 RepID=A0A4S5BFA3_9BURK|nr:8-oxoguanine DNA glycosylase [Lampropedia aestuarii]THJ30900.1 8-oxoguanine DNA glycosylase [Lampropedia aestuarii]